MDDQGLTFVGSPFEVVRALDRTYLDQAIESFENYLARVLAGSMAAGGRYNPRGEFGGFYVASDEPTAWEEIASRYRAQGIRRLPREMGMIGLLILQGRYADFTDDEVVAAWEVDLETLRNPEPNETQQNACWELGRAVRAVADFLRAPSARHEGDNLCLYPDRRDGELRYRVQFTRPDTPPPYLTQEPGESW